jgi:uncharacterized protein YbjT (DUF2867 family)
MNILLCGADGFIGRHLEAALRAAGHTVRRGVHRPRRTGDVAIDYRCDLAPEIWRDRLAGCDAAINAVGLLHERAPEDFERIHHRSPAALFAACAASGIRRVIQISALGAPTRATPYLASKHDADRALLAVCAGATVLRPSLVFGAGGASCAFFLALASLPLLGLPAGGSRRLQPIHVDDLAALVVALLAQAEPPRELEAVGGEALSFAQMLATYRRSLGFAPAISFPLPAAVMAGAARLSARLPGAVLTPETWQMLNAGSSGESVPVAALLGKAPRTPAQFVAAADAAQCRHEALARWRGQWLRGALAAIWALTAVVSLGWPQTGLTLLREAGVPGVLGGPLLIGAALLDATMAVLTLAAPRRRLWWGQAALIVFYSAFIALRLPLWLIHPFAPIVKNLAVLAMLGLLLAEEDRR